MEPEVGLKDAAHIVQPMSEHNDLSTTSSSYSRKRHHEAAAEDDDISKGYNSSHDTDLAPGHDSKRSRSSKWPRHKSPEADDRLSKGHRSRRSTVSPRPKRGSNSAPRPSKFLEGSMRDRVSNKPPSPYLGEENTTDRYAAAQSASTRVSVDTDTFYDAGIEANKPSGMYRFGKALASAFNPSAWRGINNLWKEKEKHTLDPGKALMEERQEKARKAYAELKKTGFKGTQGSSRLSMTGDVPTFRYDNPSSQDSRPISFNDSAIDVDDRRSSIDHKESHPSSRDEIMPGPNIPFVDRSISPSRTRSGRRSSLNLRTPSFQSLKKATSHIQLPSAKRNSTASEVGDVSQQVKKQPSKKDLAKQQKLVKRVSNLESKLETARQELEQSLASTPATKPVGRPTKKAFQPGALPSLPSERLLNAHVSEQGVGEDDIGVVTRAASRRITPKANPNSQLEHELQVSASAVTPSSRKRKARTSVDRNTIQKKHSEAEYDSMGWQSATAPAPPKHTRSVRKPVPTPIAPAPTRPLQRTPSANTGPGPELRRPSHLRTRPDIPAVPALPPTVSPSEVDKVAVLAMRSTPNISIPFGAHPDDVFNLRKTYPLLSTDQVDTLIGKFRPDDKVTDYTSTAHYGQPPSPALAPPSPVRSQHGFKPSISKSSLRSSKAELKGPNNSPAGTSSSRTTKPAKKAKSDKAKGKAAEMEDGEENGDVIADLNPSSKNGGKELPPYPKGEEELRKESYDWDPDVF
ncbi:MAG: hypothetical protein Q9195_005183 [Heterodermia aff. obscurata]